MINEDFGLDVEGKGKTKLLSELNDFLISQYAKKSQPVLLIDEAQNLSPDLLEEIRLLSNLETDKAKLLQIILVGQPELNKTLMLPELIQLRQRININYHISPLTLEETVKYIKHRLAVAGNNRVIKFQGEMPRIIYRFTSGIPRLINILCDLALLTAFVEGEKEVSIEIVKDVVKDLESRDYASISRDAYASETSEKEKDTDYRALAGDIALRIIEHEEAVKKTIETITLLSEKIGRLEGEVDRLKDDTDRKISGLLSRVGRLEGGDAPKGTEKSAEESSEKLLSEQVESLKKILDSVDKKLKKK